VQLVGIPLNVLAFLLLMVMAWGSWGGFVAHPARAGVIVIHLLMMPVMTLYTAGRSRGVRRASEGGPFFPLLVFHSLFTAWVMPYMDARGLWVLPGGDVLRYAGLVLLSAGALLRILPMLTLRERFSSVVAIQEGHSLCTGGIYALARHPSYLGILLLDLGFAGIFRSAIALLLIPMVFWMFSRRMDDEESLLLQEFGDEYRGYMTRTPRLVPGLY
jgi:protein-S-isoprenylcysteine O-methyltransferase Ste14